MKYCCRCKKPLPEGITHKGWCRECRQAYHKERQAKLQASGEAYLKPERAKPDEDMKYLTREDWRVFREVVDNPQMLLLFDLMQSCGLRLSEALGLCPKDFNFERGVTKVKTLKRRGHPAFFVDVPSRLLAILEGQKIPKDERYFPYPPHQAWRHFKRAVKKAKLNPRLSPHSLRHLRGLTLARVTKGDVAKIAVQLRHADPASTMKYIHYTPEERRKIAEESWEDD